MSYATGNSLPPVTAALSSGLLSFVAWLFADRLSVSAELQTDEAPGLLGKRLFGGQTLHAAGVAKTVAMRTRVENVPGSMNTNARHKLPQITDFPPEEVTSAVLLLQICHQQHEETLALRHGMATAPSCCACWIIRTWRCSY